MGVEPVSFFWLFLAIIGPFWLFLMYKCTIEIDNYQPKRRKVNRERKKRFKTKKERKSNVRYASIQKENTSEENKSKKKIEIRIKFPMIDEMEKLKKKKKDVKICASTKINIVLP